MITKPYAKNAKKHPDKQLKLIAKSLKAFGWQQPIITDKNDEIIVGHGRWMAYNKYPEGIKEPWIKKDDTLTDKQVKAYRIADNKLNESDWDMDLAIEELKELDDAELVELTGFDSDLLIEPDDKDDEVPEVPEEATAKLGEIYQLGEHRVMCGDSTKIEDVEKLMDGKKADMVFTDPPYGMKKENEGVLNDNLNYEKLLDFNKEWIPLTFAFSKEVASWYCWGIDEPLMDIYSSIIKPMAKEGQATFRNLLTWDKGNGQGQNSDLTRSYAVADEKCLFVMKGVQGFNNNSDNYFEGFEPIRSYLVGEKEKTGLNNKELTELLNTTHTHYWSVSQWTFPTKEHYEKLQEYGAFKKEYDVLKKEYDVVKEEEYSKRAYFNNTHDNMNNVWHFARTGNVERVGTGEHATPKPIDLCSRGIKSSCPEKGIVMDLFLGSGSTLIACEKTNRICYGCELDEKYIDVIIKRYEEYTGNKAKKIA